MEKSYYYGIARQDIPLQMLKRYALLDVDALLLKLILKDFSFYLINLLSKPHVTINF